MAAIQGIAPAVGNEAVLPKLDRKDESVDFANVLSNIIDNAANAERAADEKATRFAEGDANVGLHEVVISAEKAAITMRFAVTLKNRVIEAYRELMRTQI